MEYYINLIVYRKNLGRKYIPKCYYCLSLDYFSYLSTPLSLIILKNCIIYLKMGKKTYRNIYKPYLDALKPFTMT